MQKKESYKHILPHFQQPGQAYFVTWSLKDAVPRKALKRYSERLEILKSQLSDSGAANSDSPLNFAVRKPQHPKFASTLGPVQNQGAAISKSPLIRGSETASPEIKNEYYLLRKKYIRAYNDLLDLTKKPHIDLSNPGNTKIISDSLHFWSGKKLQNFAFCIMPNHVHWVFQLFETDNEAKPVYLQDLLYSVKRYTANAVNRFENRKGSLWQKESFDTTIRNEEHLYYCIEYTLNNPVVAGLVKNREDWDGNWCSE